MDELSTVQIIAVSVLPFVFAITVHEIAHGWVALQLGDKTAARMGRLSLNPIHHIDVVGTLIVPGILMFLGGFFFGWAKPVPVDFGKLHRPRRDMALVALAGPMANLGMAILWALVFRAVANLGVESISKPLAYMGVQGIKFNLMLMLLNLLPLLPLDGGRILSAVLPPRLSYRYAMTEQYGLLIMMILIATPVLSYVLSPPLGLMLNLMFDLAGMHG